METLGEIIKARIKASPYTFVQFADKIDVSDKSITRIVANVPKVRYYTLKAVLDGLNMDVWKYRSLMSKKQQEEMDSLTPHTANESPITHSEAQRRIMEGVHKMNPKMQKAFADMIDACLEVQRENKKEPET